MMRKYIATLLSLLLSVSTALSQENCEAFVADALSAVQTECEGIGRNEACYGNFEVQATGRGDDFTFEQVGDIAGISEVESIQTSPLDVDGDIWGVGLLAVQANIPDTLPGQNVTMLIFGDTEVQNLVEPSNIIEVTATSAVNIRRQPTTNATIIGSLSAGDTVSAIRRLEDGSWIQVRLSDARLGWVSASFLESELDMAELVSVDPEDALYVAPMQAAVIRTGVGALSCSDTPVDGVLIQTPEGDLTIELNINGLDIFLSSTAYIQAVPGGEMRIALLEGQAVVSAFGVIQTIPAGAQSIIPLDNDGFVSAAPGYPEAYDTNILGIPVTPLERPIEIAEPLTPTEITEIVSSDSASSGRWSVNISGNDCTLSEVQTFTFNQDSVTVVNSGGTVTLPKVGDGVYEGTVSLGSGVTANSRFEVISSTRLAGTLTNSRLNCTITADFIG